MAYSLGEIKSGFAILHNGVPHLVLSAAHTQMGRGGANLKTKLRNLTTGAVVEMTFSGNARVDEAPVEYRHATFLYRDQSGLYFMDSATYEQFQLSVNQIGEGARFLSEGAAVDILVWQGKSLGVKLPTKMTFKVTYAEPGVRGDSVSSGGTKPVTIETGAIVQAPLFIKSGDQIRINTETGQYVERA